VPVQDVAAANKFSIVRNQALHGSPTGSTSLSCRFWTRRACQINTSPSVTTSPVTRGPI